MRQNLAVKPMLPEDPIQRGFTLHTLLSQRRTGVLYRRSMNERIEALEAHYGLTRQEIMDAIKAFIEAQDAWMREHVSQWVLIMIQNQGDMHCQEAKAYLEAMPGRKIQSQTAHNLFKSELTGLGYDYTKSVGCGKLTR